MGSARRYPPDFCVYRSLVGLRACARHSTSRPSLIFLLKYELLSLVIVYEVHNVMEKIPASIH